MCSCMIEPSSLLPWKSSEMSKIIGKCSEAIVWPSDNSWRIFGNLRKVSENLLKIVKKVVFRIEETDHELGKADCMVVVNCFIFSNISL